MEVFLNFSKTKRFQNEIEQDKKKKNIKEKIEW